MANAQNDVKRHFKKGVTPRLDISMLPRDVNRVTGTLRKVLCASFNYTRKYPVKLDKFIEVLRFATNFAMTYKHYQEEAGKEKLADERLAEKEREEAKNKEVK